MGDGFRFHEKMGHDAAVEITRRTNAETCCLVQQQGVIRHEEERAGIVMLRIVGPLRDAVEDRVLGLDAGADDYLVKPFAMSELIARTKALLRRPGAALGTTLRAGNIVFDTIGRDVSVAGIPLQLPRREAAILEHLLRRQGRVVPKSVLEEKLYGI